MRAIALQQRTGTLKKAMISRFKEMESDFFAAGSAGP
jgi:hypothetical protein